MKCTSSSQHSDYGRRQVLFYGPRASSLNLKTEVCCTASPDMSVRLFCVSVPLLSVEGRAFDGREERLWIKATSHGYFLPATYSVSSSRSFHLLLPALDLTPEVLEFPSCYTTASVYLVLSEFSYAFQEILPQSIFGMFCISFETPIAS